MMFQKLILLKIETQLNIVKDKNKQIEKILIEEIININDENFGILSLTRNINSRSMWSYYSNDHQGFMISFKTEDDEKIKFPFKFYSDSIEYKEEREINLLSSISNLNNKETKIIKSLFSKDSDWTHENEFRFVIHLNVLETKKTDKRGFPIHAYVLPEGQIEAIYLGVHANPSLERKAKFWIKTFAPSVKLFKAEPCNTQYKLNYRKINI